LYAPIPKLQPKYIFLFLKSTYIAFKTFLLFYK
jgi:hypothetical protein